MKSTEFLNEGTVTETPASELKGEASDLFANDMEKVAELAYKVADATRNRNKRHWRQIWDEYAYAVGKMERATYQYTKK